MQIDYNNIDQLNDLYKSLNDIRVILNELLDEEAEVMFRFYHALHTCGVKTTLGEKGMLTELVKAGQDQLVKDYIQIEKDVHKAKNSFRQALEAINLKKHINNISPRG